MLKHYLARCVRVTLYSATLLATAPALAAIAHPSGDTFLDGSFQGMTYGISGTANLAPRLYVSDFGSTLPPYDQALSQGEQSDGEKPPIAGRIGVAPLWRFPAAGQSGQRMRRETEGTGHTEVPSVY